MLKKQVSRKQVMRWVKIILLLLLIAWIVTLGILTGSLFNRVTRLRQFEIWRRSWRGKTISGCGS
jgi:hypothetical protein